MSTYRQTLAEHIRLCILRLLEESVEYESNNSILTDGVALYGLRATRDMVNTDLAWLAEQNLVRLDHVGSRLIVVRLTSRGADVAKGTSTIPGVRKRGPED